jgi:hypothetical protein
MKDINSNTKILGIEYNTHHPLPYVAFRRGFMAMIRYMRKFIEEKSKELNLEPGEYRIGLKDLDAIEERLSKKLNREPSFYS